MTTKPVLFIDFDGTLCHDRFWRGLPVDQYQKVQEVLFGEDRTYLQDWMRGKKTSEEVNQYLAAELGVPHEGIWETFVKDSQTMHVDHAVLEQIKELRDRFTTILITVNMDSLNRFTVPALHLDSYFDAISNSYDEGIFKTENDGEVFKKYADKYAVLIKDCSVIDDSVGVCKLFEDLGGTAYLVDSQKDIGHYLAQLN
ncbi:MAG: hypothetical protein JWM39_68 [Parcubacteria group bacterium]|nr:hypothetical protein [Parcubacteria group bacterium]